MELPHSNFIEISNPRDFIFLTSSIHCSSYLFIGYVSATTGHADGGFLFSGVSTYGLVRKFLYVFESAACLLFEFNHVRGKVMLRRHEPYNDKVFRRQTQVRYMKRRCEQRESASEPVTTKTHSCVAPVNDSTALQISSSAWIARDCA